MKLWITVSPISRKKWLNESPKTIEPRKHQNLSYNNSAEHIHWHCIRTSLFLVFRLCQSGSGSTVGGAAGAGSGPRHHVLRYRLTRGAQEQGSGDQPAAADPQTVTYMMAATAPQQQQQQQQQQQTQQTAAAGSAAGAAATSESSDPLAQATRVSPATVRIHRLTPVPTDTASPSRASP